MYAAADSVCLAGLTESGSPRLGMLDGTGEYTALELPADVTEVSAVFLSDGGVRALAATGDGLCLLAYGPDGSGPERTPLSGAQMCIRDRYYGTESGRAELHSEAETDAVIAAVTGKEFSIQSVKRGKKQRSPSPPFITSTLQQEASRRLGMTPRRTMSIAQQLYEGVDVTGMGTVGLITYMRTCLLYTSCPARSRI